MIAVENYSTADSMVENTIKKRPHHTTNEEKQLRDSTIKRQKRGKVFSSVFSSLPNIADDDEEEDSAPATDTTPIDLSSCKTVIPNADDYANLLFYKSPEAEDVASRIHTIEKKKEMNIVTKRNYKQKKTRRRISFGAAIPTIHYLADVPSVHTITPEEKATLWYSRADLEEFKSCAQLSINDIKNIISIDKNAYKDRTKFRILMLSFEDNTNTSIRGLESRIFRRKYTRQMLIKDVIECQTHVDGLVKFGMPMGDEQMKSKLLAKVSKERSKMAKNLALVDAKDDYKEVLVCSSN